MPQVMDAQREEAELEAGTFVLLPLEPCEGAELPLIAQCTEPSAPLSVGSDPEEKPGSGSPKHLQKTSGKENQAAVTPKGSMAARNPQVPHQLLR